MNRIRMGCAVTTLVVFMAQAGTLQQTTFFSTVLNKDMQYNIYLPANYAQASAAGDRFPVVYLLHGYNSFNTGNADIWHLGLPSNLNPQTDKAVDSVHLIVVAPDDGVGNSWWMDSPVLTEQKLSTYLAVELKNRIDSIYATLPDRAHTGLCGASMGGYGAFHNGLVSADKYSVVYGMVSVTCLQSYKSERDTLNDLDLVKVLGPYSQNTANWVSMDVLCNAGEFAGRNLRIGFYENINDFFVQQNARLDSAFTALSVPHDYALYQSGGLHDLPDLARMTVVLRYFDTAFSSVPVIRGDSRADHHSPQANSRPAVYLTRCPRPAVRVRTQGAEPALFDVAGKRLLQTAAQSDGTRRRTTAR